ncbi:MobA/MobL family protein [Anaerospora hongkongensis]|uniref:MobA/MobL family protein n=1 Tax=Anaerospora hongkongensis TaxID=244830 RepID=UPI00289DEAB6|nr:MobA/MobL family protein [Anaerospora hongkongensis]
MACYHFTIKPDRRPDNTQISATDHADYINRAGKYKDIDEKEQALTITPETKVSAASHAEYINREANYQSKGGCIYTDRQLPDWANHSPRKFFDAAEAFEGNGYSRYKEIEFALPNELTLEQNKEIINQFIARHLQDFYYAYAIHDKDAAMENGERNTHVHIMFSERKIDESERLQARTAEQFFSRPFVPSKKNPEMTLENRGGCRKDPKWNGRDRAAYTCEMRKDFAMIQNATLEKYNHAVRVDHRSLPAQREAALQRGDFKMAELLDRLPEKHLGPKIAAQKNHKDVIALQQYRAFKAEHRQLLFAADMLESAIEKAEISEQINAAQEQTANLVQTDTPKADSLQSLQSLKNNVLNTLREVSALEKTVIWRDQALVMAQKKFMSPSEQAAYDHLKNVQDEHRQLRQFQNAIRRPPEWDHDACAVFDELMTEMVRRNQELDHVSKEASKAMRQTFARLQHPVTQKRVQAEVQRILQDDQPAKAMLKVETTKLNLLVPRLQAEVAKGLQEEARQATSPSGSSRMTAKEVSSALRASIRSLDTDIDHRTKVLGKMSAQVITLPRAKEMAKDIFCKGAYKQLREQRRLLEKELPRIEAAKNEYIQAKFAFEQLKKPRWYQSKDTYNAEEKKLLDMQLVISQRENMYAEKVQALDMQSQRLDSSCNSPSAQKKISQITLGILKKNQSISQKFEEVSKQQTAALNNRKELQSLQSTVQNQIQIDRGQQIAYQVKGGGSHSMQAGIIAKALNGNAKAGQLVARFVNDEEIYDGMSELDKRLAKRDRDIKV